MGQLQGTVGASSNLTALTEQATILCMVKHTYMKLNHHVYMHSSVAFNVHCHTTINIQNLFSQTGSLITNTSYPFPSS